MSSPVVQLPEAQLRPLLAAYDASVRTRRWHTLLVLACIVAAMLLASVSAEVSPARFIDNIGRFPSYIIRLFQLENGQPAWTDFTEWFWGLPRWLRLLGETLLMAYVGTAAGRGRRLRPRPSWPPPMSGRAAGCASPCGASASFAAPCRCWSSRSCS